MGAGMCMPYTVDEIKTKVERDSECTFISTDMRPVKNSNSTKRWLKLKCMCGETFEVAWVKFNRKDGRQQRQCQECGKKIRASHHTKSLRDYLDDDRYKLSGVEYITGFNGVTKNCTHKCPTCKRIDWMPTPKNILQGVSECETCSRKRIGERTKKDDHWYQDQKMLLGINIENVEPYIDSETPIKHICVRCKKTTLKRPGSVLSKNQVVCESCSYEIRGENQSLNEKVLRDKLTVFRCDYMGGEIAGKYSTVTFKCQCGELFEKPIASVISKGLDRCSKCAASESEGELFIREWLTNNDFEFIAQQKFDDLRGLRKMPLSYDFGVYKNGALHTLIEYDGAHHFKPVGYGNYTPDGQLTRLIKVRERDKRKNEYAKKNGYNLIRLSGNDHKNLDSILKPLLSKC